MSTIERARERLFPESMEVTIHVVSMILVFVDKRQSIKIPIRNRNNCIRSDDMLY